MARLTEKVNANLASKRKSLIAYIVAGDPEKEMTVQLMHKMVDAGVDIIELGVPFSDPEAEGPVIQVLTLEIYFRSTTMRGQSFCKIKW